VAVGAEAEVGDLDRVGGTDPRVVRLGRGFDRVTGAGHREDGLGRGVREQDAFRQLHMEKYSDFRQFPKYHATFADNAEVIYQQLEQ